GSRLLSWNANASPSPRGQEQDEEVRLHDAEGKELAKLTLASGPLMAAFRPDGKQFAVSCGAVVAVHDAEGKRLRTLRAAGQVRILTYSPDGKQLAAAGGSRVRAWETQQWRQVPTRASAAPAGEVEALAFPRDGQLLAVNWVQHQVRVWDAGTGEVTGASS